jgi:hypothetical protein
MYFFADSSRMTPGVRRNSFSEIKLGLKGFRPQQFCGLQYVIKAFAWEFLITPSNLCKVLSDQIWQGINLMSKS